MRIQFDAVLQWRIQDFPDEEAPTPKMGAKTYYLAKFVQNEEISGRGGGEGGASLARLLDPPLSKNAVPQAA